MMSIDQENVNQAIKISITINQCHGLRGTKSENFISTTKVEFGNTILGESSKVENDNTSKICLFDFTCGMEVAASDVIALDELAHTPLVVTFNEILPKDKKSKEEKIVSIGKCCIGVLPLLEGKDVIELSVPINLPTTPESNADHSEPIVEIKVSASKPILTEEQLKKRRLLSICMNGLYSPPETWISSGGQFIYSAALSLPESREKDHAVVIPNGQLKSSPDQVSNKQLRWPNVQNVQSHISLIPDRFFKHGKHDDEDGDLKSSQDINFRIDAETSKPFVNWCSECCCYIPADSIDRFKSKIIQHRYLPIEIARSNVPNLNKGKGLDDSTASFHGIAYVDIAPLLYPGIKSIRGAYLIHPFDEEQMLTKTGCQSSLLEEINSTANGIMRTLSSSMGNIKSMGKGGKQDPKAKPSAALLKTDIPESGDAKKTESQQYVDAHSYIILEINLDSPLVKRKAASLMDARIAEMIPPRPLFPKKIGGAKKAVEDFQTQIQSTASILLDEYRSMFGSVDNHTDEEQTEEWRKEFLYELNSSGKYFAFKEQLKIVREKFLATTEFENKEKLQYFLSILYPYLVDQMHVGLNKFLETEETVEIPPSISDSAILKHFAKVAEGYNQFEEAARYHQQRVVLNKTNPEVWNDYGIFCLSIRDYSKAEECFRESVSLDQKNLTGLVLFGCLMLFNEHLDKAELSLEAATYAQPDSIVAWIALGLFYVNSENAIMSERSFNQANRLFAKIEKNNSEDNNINNSGNGDEQLCNKCQNLDSKSTSCVDEKEIQVEPLVNDIKLTINSPINGTVCTHSETGDSRLIEAEKYGSVFLIAANFFIQNGAIQMAERSLAHDLVANQECASSKYYQLLSKYHMKMGNYSGAKEAIDASIKLCHEDSSSWSIKGHIDYIRQQYNDAKVSYERSLAYENEPIDLLSVYHKLGAIYLDQCQFSSAKDIYLKACQLNQSSYSWLGVGISCYELEMLTESEEALNQANILNNLHGDVWAYLALISLKTNRFLEAEQAYKYTKKLGVQDKTLLQKITHAMTISGFDQTAT